MQRERSPRPRIIETRSRSKSSLLDIWNKAILITIRPFNSIEHDLGRIVDVVQDAWRPRRRSSAYFHVGDLYWRMRERAFEESLRLWEDAAGMVAGFCA